MKIVGKVETSNGLVENIPLHVFENEGTTWKLSKLEVLGESKSGGRTVCKVFLYDKDNNLTSEPVALAYPYDGATQRFLNALKPGNNNVPIEHMITNGFNASSSVGPLGIYVEKNDKIDSDVIAGIGLPWNRHISFNIHYRLREQSSVTLPDEPINHNIDIEDILNQVSGVKDSLKLLPPSRYNSIAITDTEKLLAFIAYYL